MSKRTGITGSILREALDYQKRTGKRAVVVCSSWAIRTELSREHPELCFCSVQQVLSNYLRGRDWLAYLDNSVTWRTIPNGRADEFYREIDAARERARYSVEQQSYH